MLLIGGTGWTSPRPPQPAASPPGRSVPLPGTRGSSPPSPTPAASQASPRSPRQSNPPDSDAPEPGSELRVWLVTIGPGEIFWERFGHNALRVLDTSTGRDVSYNWGIFDFNQTDFIPRFLKGQMLYSMAGYDTRGMIAAYAQTGRDVVLQELNLTPAERLELRAFVETNALPENRDYFYQYFLDNCSTRVRDVLDLVLDGALSDRFTTEPTGTSYRWHIRRVTEPDPLLYTGMDLLLGRPGDAPISVWEEMFLPVTLRDALRDATRPGPDGRAEPLVLSEEEVVPSSIERAPELPPSWLPWYLLIGVTLGTSMALLGWLGARSRGPRRGAPSRSVWLVALAVGGGAWSLLAGVAGLLLVGVLFTDHTFMYSNANLFLFTPVSLAVAAGVILTVLRSRPPTWWVVQAAWFVAGAALLALLWEALPMRGQTNGIFQAMAVPVHVGLAVALTLLRRPSATA